MNGNKFGSWLGIRGFGESHGAAVGVLLEDIKPGIRFPLKEIEQEMERRRPGRTEFTSSRQESDRIKILSGVIDGITTGMPICLVVYNEDQRSEDYALLKDIFRPGHADWSWYQKFKILDWRGGGRASGRETIARVAAGAVVKELIKPIIVEAYPVQIGKIRSGAFTEGFTNQLFWHDPNTYDAVLQELSDAKEAGDSLGGILEIRISDIKAGLGDPVFGKLDAKLAEALLSIGGVKGIEFGAGFKLAGWHGSLSNDQMDASGFLTNHCGGIIGGISTGEPVIMHLVVKPTSSISKKQKTVDVDNTEQIIEIKGRHDTCLIFRIIPVAEAMVRLVLADCVSYQNLVEGKERSLDNYREVLDRIDEDILLALKRRNEIIKLIGEYKLMKNLNIHDTHREIELINDLKSKAELWKINPQFVESIWQLILADSRKSQEGMKNDSTKSDT
ncbi:MAG: chorismate synthase [Candidatus Stygibacter australis]|nr:chorismate synthase [Candidatus Stygibacter australis]MDP8320890.1 chorismate synthase [Candidatus Stygibacter australis]